ncbi:MAG: glucosaminidase domain-containing protein [Cyclobacteriaceae bacterium]
MEKNLSTPPSYIRILWLCVLIVGCSSNRYKIDPQIITVDSLSQVVLLHDSLVQPIAYTQVRGLEEQPIPQAKQLFISIILPSILIAKFRLNKTRQELQELQDKKKWNQDDSTFYLLLKDKYKAKDITTLLRRMQTLPNSIILAQAAVESGWGQSRFFREGNNVFGIWSYNSDEPRLQASVQRSENAVYVRAYENISQSIENYFETIGKARAYRSLRSQLSKTNDPYLLLPHLKYYSERRMDYVEQLREIIDQNNLRNYDSYVIDPKFIIAE